MPGGSGKRRLVAGDLSIELIGMDVRDVTWRGVQVLSRLYGALRDSTWATVAGSPLDFTVEEDVDGFVVHFSCDHRPAGMPFVWSGTIEGSSDALTVTFDGQAHDGFAANRIGWCLLHPLSQVGGRARFSLAERTDERPLPFLVAPQPLGPDGGVQPAWGPFDRLAIDADGVRTCIHFEGDLFEMEDQRNWTDASFKTYSTPLSEPRPRTLIAGDRVRQVLNFSFAAGQRTASETTPAPPRQHGTTHLTAVVKNPNTPLRDVMTALTVVGGLRAEVSADTPAELHAAAEIITLARRAHRWDLSVLASSGTAWDALDRLVAEGSPPEVILILPRAASSGDPDECTTVALVTQARAGLPAAVPSTIGGGTRFNFCELQRHDLRHLPHVSCTFSPRVHAEDEQSIRETTASYGAVAATAKEVAPHAKFVVGPLRDPNGLPSGWVADSVRAWHAAGVGGVCVAEISTLVREGQLTDVGESMSRLALGTSVPGARMDPP